MAAITNYMKINENTNKYQILVIYKPGNISVNRVHKGHKFAVLSPKKMSCQKFRNAGHLSSQFKILS